MYSTKISALAGAALAAVLAVSMVATPALATIIYPDYLTIEDVDVEYKSSANDKNTLTEVTIDVGDDVPDDANLFGYAALTDGLNNVLVLVAHVPVDDSRHEDKKTGRHTHVLDLTSSLSAACDAVPYIDLEVDLANSVANQGFDLDAAYSVDGDIVTMGPVPTKFLGDDTVEAVVSFTVTPIFDGDGNLTNICVDVVQL